MTPAPSFHHQGVAGSLNLILGPFVREHRLGRVYFALADVLLSKHDIVQSDLLVISNDRACIVTEANAQGGLRFQ